MAETIIQDPRDLLNQEETLKESKYSEEGSIQGIDDKSQELMKSFSVTPTDIENGSFKFMSGKNIDTQKLNLIYKKVVNDQDVVSYQDIEYEQPKYSYLNSESKFNNIALLNDIRKLKEIEEANKKTQEIISKINDIESNKKEILSETNMKNFKDRFYSDIESKKLSKQTQLDYFSYQLLNKEINDNMQHINSLYSKTSELSSKVKGNFDKNEILNELNKLDSIFHNKQVIGRNKDKDGNDVPKLTNSTGKNYYSDLKVKSSDFELDSLGNIVRTNVKGFEISEWEDDMNKLKFSLSVDKFDVGLLNKIESKLKMKSDVFGEQNQLLTTFVKDTKMTMNTNNITSSDFSYLMVDHYQLNQQTNKRELKKVNVLDGLEDLDEEKLKRRLDQILNDNLENTGQKKSQWMNDTRKKLQEEAQSKGKTFGDMSAVDYISFYKMGIYITDTGMSLFNIYKMVKEHSNLSNKNNEILEKFRELKAGISTETLENNSKELVPMISNISEFKDYDEFKIKFNEWQDKPENQNKDIKDYFSFLQEKSIQNNFGKDGLNIEKQDFSIVLNDYYKIQEEENILKELESKFNDLDININKIKLYQDDSLINFETNNMQILTKLNILDNFNHCFDNKLDEEERLANKEFLLSIGYDIENYEKQKEFIKNGQTNTKEYLDFKFNEMIKDKPMSAVEQAGLKLDFNKYIEQKNEIQKLKDNSSLHIVSFFKKSDMLMIENEINDMNLDSIKQKYELLNENFSNKDFKLIESKLEKGEMQSIELKLFFDQMNILKDDLKITENNLLLKKEFDLNQLKDLKLLDSIYTDNPTLIKKEDVIEFLNSKSVSNEQRLQLSKLLSTPLQSDGKFDKSIELMNVNDCKKRIEFFENNLEKTQNILTNINVIKTKTQQHIISIDNAKENKKGDKQIDNDNDIRKLSLNDDLEKIVNKPENRMSAITISKLNANIPKFGVDASEDFIKTENANESKEFANLNKSNKKMFSDVGEVLKKHKAELDNDKTLSEEQKEEKFISYTEDAFESISKQSAVGHLLLANMKHSLKDGKLTSKSILDNLIHGGNVNYEEGLKNIIQTLLYNKQSVQNVILDMQKNGELDPYIKPENLLGTSLKSESLNNYQKSVDKLIEYVEKNGINYDLINMSEINKNLSKLGDGNLKNIDKSLEKIRENFIRTTLDDKNLSKIEKESILKQNEELKKQNKSFDLGFIEEKLQQKDESIRKEKLSKEQLDQEQKEKERRKEEFDRINKDNVLNHNIFDIN